MPNRLAHESSPYLLQHANNPVDWFGWNDEAWQLAKDQQKPVFLSIGYSACHWCHVMEHESFESQEIADYLNENFISIKVDREERPDLDSIYMNAVQMLTGHGGWPMSVFLTPDKMPFFGGTYWPPTPMRGMPGFGQVLHAVQDAWEKRRDTVLEQSQELARRIQSIGHGPAAESIKPGLVSLSATQLQERFDDKFGGFGDAPKFPQTMNIDLLMRHYHETRNERLLNVVTTTLDKMARGGIYDHLGGGFARYSVDRRWLVPHFEKMLYDNALLVCNYVDAYRLTGNNEYAQVVRETCDYILREMTDESGGFHSTEDADSEGEEGKFYVWTRQEVANLLADTDVYERFCEIYDVSTGGNFEGKSILNMRHSWAEYAKQFQTTVEQLQEEMAAARQVLLNARSQRVRPGKDDKILTGWNGLMIEALAGAGSALNEPRYQQAAAHAARFILHKLTDESGRLLHTYRHGQAKLMGYLDDYAYMAAALFALFESTQQTEWLVECEKLVEMANKHFYDQQDGGYFYTADDHEALIARSKDFYDQSIPGPNGVMALTLAKLGSLLGDANYQSQAEEVTKAGGSVIGQHPTAAGQLLIAHDFSSSPSQQIVLAGEPGDQLDQAWQTLQKRYLPKAVLVKSDGTAEDARLAKLTQAKSPQGGEPTIYACRNFSCEAPVSAEKFFAENS